MEPVILAGAGPGRPGLLTLRAAEALHQADYVLFDRLVPRRLLEHCRPQAELVSVEQLPGEHCEKGPLILQTLIAQAQLGKKVVRLHGGDPFVFGRGGEEAEALRRAGIPYEVVPGVSSGLAAPAFAGIPLTHRSHSSAVAFVTGHERPGKPGSRLDWNALARFPGTLVIFMGLKRASDIASRLVAGGLPTDTPAAAIQAGSLGRQRTVVTTLGDLPSTLDRANLASPTMLVIGSVVGLREQLAWFEKQPLFGRTVLVTRPRRQAGEMVQHLESLGATALVLPTVEIRDLDDTSEVDAILGRLAEFHWLVFTSVNGVHAFLRRLKATGRDLRALGLVKLAAIGPSTADALRDYHLEADLVPEVFRSEELAEALKARVEGQRVLLARANRGREVLRDELATVAEVVQVAVYRQEDELTASPDVLAALDRGEVDTITLTSSNIARGLAKLIGDEARKRILAGEIRLVSISPVTSAAIREVGWPVAAEATEYTTAGVIRAACGLA